MSSTRRTPTNIAVAIAAALAMVVTLLPTLSGRATDHLDAPELSHPGGDAAADIGDLYAFGGASADTTVLAMTVNPDAQVDATFGADLLYELKVDTDGDAVEDESYEFTFSESASEGVQFVVARHAQAEAAANGTADGELVGFGRVGSELELSGGGMLFAGLRADPSFYDLDALAQIDTGEDLTAGTDAFADQDVLSIVIEVPDYETGIDVWATTSGADGEQIDRMGLPAMNLLVNNTGTLVGADVGAKTAYNQGEPADDDTAFTASVVAALEAYSTTDTEAAYTPAEAGEVADLLVPDVLHFEKNGPTDVISNGRAPSDDAVDTMLNVMSGGDPLDLFAGRDETGGITGDGIDAHTDYLDAFPYLGEPHADPTYPEVDATNFMAALSGDNEVPPVDTGASGVSAFHRSDSGLEYLNVAHQLESAVAAHIHLGGPDENGPIVAFLYGPSDGEDVNGILSQGTLTEEDVLVGSMDDLVDAMASGFAYVNAHTTANPAGEIRGQISSLDTVDDRFTDDDTSVHEANIDLIAAARITIGCNPPENSEYCPTRDITRGEMAAFLARAFNLPDGPEAFTDDDDSIFEGDINAIADVGITIGCNPPENTEFCPDDPLTRGEMAAFLNRAFNLADSDVDAFEDDEASVFEGDIDNLAQAGITIGCNPPDNTEYCPTRNIIRAEMASFLARAFGWGS